MTRSLTQTIGVLVVSILTGSSLIIFSNKIVLNDTSNLLFGLKWGMSPKEAHDSLLMEGSGFLEEGEIQAQVSQPEFQVRLKTEALEIVPLDSSEKNLQILPLKPFRAFQTEVLGQLRFQESKLREADFHFVAVNNIEVSLNEIIAALKTKWGSPLKEISETDSKTFTLSFKSASSMILLWVNSEKKQISLFLSDRSFKNETTVDFTLP